MYNSLRAQKIKDRSTINSAAAHNFRLHTQPNIDASRSDQNQVLLNNLEADLTTKTGVSKAFMGLYDELGAKQTKESVLALEMIITASPEAFEAMTPKQVDQWAREQVEFAQEQFGQNCRLAVLHMDEKTPHIHFLISTEEKKLVKYKNRHGVSEKEKVTLNAKRWNPEFFKKLHDDHGSFNEKWGLKRGDKGSKKVHQTVKEYYAALNKQEQLLNEGLVEHKVHKELLNRAKKYMRQAKNKMDEQYNEIIGLLDIVTGKELNPAEQEFVNSVVLKKIQEQKQKQERDKKRLGGGTPQTPP